MLDFESEIETLGEKGFVKKYGTDVEGFQQLLNIIEKKIVKDEESAARRAGEKPTPSDWILALTIRVILGAKQEDICSTLDLSEAAFKRAFESCLKYVKEQDEAGTLDKTLKKKLNKFQKTRGLEFQQVNFSAAG